MPGTDLTDNDAAGRPGGARTRADGIAKVTGAAGYTADRFAGQRRPAGWAAVELRHAVLVTATVPAGRITGIDTTAAEAMPGVTAVLTHRTAPRLRPARGPYGQTVLPLQDDVVRYEGEPVAVVVADTLERAQRAASAVRVEYQAAPVRVRLEDVLDQAYLPTES